MCCSNLWSTIGAVVAGLAVVAGSFGAHGVDKFFVEKYEGQTKQVAGVTIPAAEKYLRDFNTAADYQMYHGLALLAVGMLSSVRPKKSLQLAGWSFMGGVLLFSGSLYALTLTGITKLGMITPIGGTLFIVGWVALAAGACPCTNADPQELDPGLPE